MLWAYAILTVTGFLIWFPLLAVFIAELKKIDFDRFGGLGFGWSRIGSGQTYSANTNQEISSSPVLFLLKGEFLRHGKKMKIIGASLILFCLVWFSSFLYVYWSDIKEKSDQGGGINSVSLRSTT